MCLGFIKPGWYLRVRPRGERLPHLVHHQFSSTLLSKEWTSPKTVTRNIEWSHYKNPYTGLMFQIRSQSCDSPESKTRDRLKNWFKKHYTEKKNDIRVDSEYIHSIRSHLLLSHPQGGDPRGAFPFGQTSEILGALLLLFWVALNSLPLSSYIAMWIASVLFIPP